jgi:hypothetical protein
METETGGVAYVSRSAVGDHMTATGRWIFDCGHDPKTEVHHPMPAFESDHLEQRPIGYAPGLRQVRVVRVHLNSDPGQFSYTLGPFSFHARFRRAITAARNRSCAFSTGRRA